MAGKERPISRKARRYLAEFEAWLHDRRPNRSREKREDTLEDLVDGIVPSVEEELATAERCPNCGGPMLRNRKGSGPRLAFCCEDCRAESEGRRRER